MFYFLCSSILHSSSTELEPTGHQEFSLVAAQFISVASIHFASTRLQLQRFESAATKRNLEGSKQDLPSE
jgi:hypothetical protein